MTNSSGTNLDSRQAGPEGADDMEASVPDLNAVMMVRVGGEA